MNELLLTHRVRRVTGVISTDDILPAIYKHASSDPKVLASHLFEYKYPGFAKSIEPGDIIVTNQLFGTGSSREQAVSALSASGISAVIAPCFGRIFYRNAWNLGLIALEIKADQLLEHMVIRLSLEEATLTSDEFTLHFSPVAPEMIDVIRCGGLLQSIKRTYAE